MSAYPTDQEQIEVLKRWWRDYGKFLLIAIIVGAAAGLSWRYWHQQQDSHIQKASSLYQQILVENNNKKPELVENMIQEMQRNYSDTIYASMSNLLMAKIAIEKNQYNMALQKLEWVKDKTHVPSIQQIARLRIARILLEQKKMQAALDILAKVYDSSYQPLIDSVKGDIYLALGEREKAQQVYQTAQIGLSSLVGQDLLTAMKLAQPL